VLRYLKAVVESHQEAAYSDQYKAYKELQKGFQRMDLTGI